MICHLSRLFENPEFKILDIYHIGMSGHGVMFRPLDFIFLLETATYLCLKNGKFLPAAIICAYLTFWSALYIVSSQMKVVMWCWEKHWFLSWSHCIAKFTDLYWKKPSPKNPQMWWNGFLCCHSVHSWELGLGGSGSFIQLRFLELRWR